jgi:transmembrane sensor
MAGLKVSHNEKGELMFTAPNDPPNPKKKFYQVDVPRGGLFIVKFPDGTMARMNAQSNLEYPVHFKTDTNRIHFKGEVYLETSSKTVLQIETPGGLLQTRGAHINLRGYPDDQAFKVTLLEGSAIWLPVAKDSHYGDGVQLHPGEQAITTGNQLTVLPSADTMQVVAWTNNRIFFHDETLPIIMREISRWYDADVVFKGSIPDKRYSLDLPRDANFSDVQKTLRQQGVNLFVEKRTITVNF